MRRFALLIALLVSLVGWTGYLVNQPRASPQGDLSRGWFSDHFSHMHACRALLFGGVNLWRTPLRAALAPLTPGERASLPGDLRAIAGQPNSESYRLPSSPVSKPVVASWSHLPRPYPPGDLVAVLPAALLYELFDVSFQTASHFLIWLFVLYAHLAVFLFAKAATARQPSALAATVLVYFESIHWALEGFYDVAALIPLSLFGLAVARRQWLWALLAYSVGAFFHFRAFFFGPWALLAAWHLFRSGAWKSWRRREWAMVGATVLFSVAALWSFFAVAPALPAFPLDNPVAWSAGWQGRIGLVALMLAGTFVFGLARSWPDTLIAVWIFVMVVSLRQAFAWHALLLLPWLVIRDPSVDDHRTAVTDVTRLGMVIAVSVLVFRSPLVPSWLSQLP